MKKLLLLLSYFVYATDLFAQNQQNVNLDVKSFKMELDKQQGIILDVRTPEEVAQGYIENASMIDFYDENFQKKISVMDKSKSIYVYCKAGGRSSQAADILIKSGFAKVFNLEGGIMAWEEAGYKITKLIAVKDDLIQGLSVPEFEKLLKEHSFLLADFHTIWCAPCKKLAPIIDELEIEYGSKLKTIRVDIDKSKDLSKRESIKGIPVLVLYKNGIEVWRNTGFIEKKPLIEALNVFLK